MKSILIALAFATFMFVSCSSRSGNETKYIEDTVVHEADSPIIKDQSMVPGPDTTDRNLDNPHSKQPD